MQSRQFRQMSKVERKAKLVKVLIEKCPALSKPHLEAIANHRWGVVYRLELLEEFDLIEKQLKIVVHTSVKEFAEVAKLRRTGMVHSWAGESTTKQFGNWIVGDGEFGLYVDMAYSNNGDIGSPESADIAPEFNLSQIQVIAVKTVEHDSFNRSESFNEEIWELHILLPNSEFNVDPVVFEIIQRFNLDGEIAADRSN